MVPGRPLGEPRNYLELGRPQGARPLRTSRSAGRLAIVFGFNLRTITRSMGVIHTENRMFSSVRRQIAQIFPIAPSADTPALWQ